MVRKILAFVYNGKEFLALHSEQHPTHGKGGWFTVTGGVEGGESLIEAVKREVKEETGLDAEEVFYLNWGSIYNWRDERCEENNFVAFVRDGKVILNEEHNNSEWVGINEFVNLIKWDDDKKILFEVLGKAVKRKTYFKEEEIKDYTLL